MTTKANHQAAVKRARAERDEAWDRICRAQEVLMQTVPCSKSALDILRGEDRMPQ